MVVASQLWGTETWGRVWALPLPVVRSSLIWALVCSSVKWGWSSSPACVWGGPTRMRT